MSDGREDGRHGGRPEGPSGTAADAASATDVARRSGRPQARLPRGFVDRPAEDLTATARMLDTIRTVYERYGFTAMETPFVEYTDALGKFLPDQDRPNEGVFSFEDDDGQWLSLRYDLTAPLARHVAEHYERLPKPFRSLRAGYVFRNEKPGPGRFRQFLQCDADIVGARSVAADAEICMMAADTLEALGIPHGDYVIKVNNRKILDGVMEAIGLGDEENAGRRLTVLRAIDKLDKFARPEIAKLLGSGRLDESGDFTKGAGLDEQQIAAIFSVMDLKISHDIMEDGSFAMRPANDLPFAINERFQAGIRDLVEMGNLFEKARYGSDRISIDPSVVRGLEYYTGPVFEAELTFEIPGEDGRPMRFGSVGGGGRYDGLIGRFRGEDVPATGFSIGVSRLVAALKAVKSPIVAGADATPLVIVTVMDRDRIGDYQRFAATLRKEGREAGLRADVYLGEAGFGAQMKYADRRGAVCAVIQGSDEKAQGLVQIKDLMLGAELAAMGREAKGRADYLAKQAEAQFAVPESELVAAVKRVIARHS